MPVIIDKITSFKVRAPPTLRQYLLNKAMKEASAQTKQASGVVRVEGRLMPKSASMVGESMKGITADKVMEMHPDWVDQYPEYLKEWEAKNSG